MISKVENRILLCSETFYLSITSYPDRAHVHHTNEYAHYMSFVNIDPIKQFKLVA